MHAVNRRPSLRRTIALPIGLVVALAVSLPASAATPAHGRITRGDVTSAFQARTTGGYVNGLAGRTVAAPVRGLHDGRISSFTDTSHCAADWHYLGVTLLAEGGRDAAARYLRQVTVTYAIDGVPVTPTMRTAIKPFVGTGIRGQFGVSVGKLVAPGSVSAGDHVLETAITTPDGGSEILDITFNLSPDACA